MRIGNFIIADALDEDGEVECEVDNDYNFTGPEYISEAQAIAMIKHLTDLFGLKESISTLDNGFKPSEKLQEKGTWTRE